VGLRAVLEAVVKRKIPSPYRNPNPRHPACTPALYHCWGFLNNLTNAGNEGHLYSVP